jgi:polyhydroxyalkanoate synthase
MQPHQELQRALLPAFDMMDRLMAISTRARLHAQAATARLMRGEPPIQYIQGPASKFEVVSEGPLARLLKYPAGGEAAAKKAVPLVVVSSLINRYYVLDLLPEISVFSMLQEKGFDIYVLDWKAVGDLGPTLRFADYVDGAIAAAVGDASRLHGQERAHVMGYCMGGTMAAMYAALKPETVKSLILLGTPIDFHSSGQLASWTKRELFDADLLIDCVGNMPPALMQSGFKGLNPADAFFKIMKMFVEAGDEKRVRHMVALEAWLEDNVAFPGGVYREYIKGLYQDNALQRGDFLVGGTAVDLKKIAAPLLNVIAHRDHICRPAASRVLTDLVSSTDKNNLEFDTGHIGMTTSRKALKELWPRVIAWLEAHA